MAQHKENVNKGTALSRRSLTLPTSKISSSSDPSSRPPMLDISNKLHALVDEFVSNLSSECDTLANNVSTQAHLYLARDNASETTRTPRPSNRTATEVLNGLKRPTDMHVIDPVLRERKSHLQHASAKSKEAHSRTKDGGRYSQKYELLSSDDSSDECRRPSTKLSRKLLGNQRAAKVRNSRPRSSSTALHTESHVRSPESSHHMDFSYEGDTKSIGGRSLDADTTFQKLRWPQDIEDLLEDAETEKESEDNVAHCNKKSQQKNGRTSGSDDIILEEADESSEEEAGGAPNGTESDVEELPVLPKVPVKRKLQNENGASQRRSQRGKAKITSPQVKKNKSPQIDASVITQLSFGRRPANSVSSSTM